MQNTLRTMMGRRAATLLALPLLLASTSAAVPITLAQAAASADRVMWRDVYYSDDTYTTVVGIGHAYCDNDYIMTNGYPTIYFTTYYAPPCP
jgi:Mn2+/Fe2+ NRAMP family transporter